MFDKLKEIPWGSEIQGLGHMDHDLPLEDAQTSPEHPRSLPKGSNTQVSC